MPGRNAAAILVSAHYDSAVEGPGAGDNALNVAAALEIARATLAGGIPTNTIIFNFTDGEELGLLGADAFLDHPWFKEVAAFVNLDASGAGGRQLMLQVTPGRDDLLEAYAASARYVHGTVLAQEIFQVLPFDTDYHVYRDAGLGGLDLAPYGDGYAYHTPLDRTERLSRRTLQESGENVLALLRGMNALSPARRHEVAAPATYYDLLGVVMVRYSAGDGADRRSPGRRAGVDPGLPPRSRDATRLLDGASARAAVGLSTFLAILVPILGSVLVTVAGHTMFWYARPWTALCVYGTLAAAGVLAGHAVLRWVARRRALLGAPNAWGRGLVVCWALLLLIATALRFGSGYLALWWCAGATLALVASTHLDRRQTLDGHARWRDAGGHHDDAGGGSVADVDGAAYRHARRRERPPTLLIAAITALAVAPFALLVAPAIQPAPSRRQVGAWSVGAAAMMVLLVASSFPYTPERPKRAYLDVRASGEDGAHVVVEAIDSGPAFAIERRRDSTRQSRGPHRRSKCCRPRRQDHRSRAPSRSVSNAPGAYLVDVALEGGTISPPSGSGDGQRTTPGVGRNRRSADLPRRARVREQPSTFTPQAFYVGSDVSVDHVLAQLPRWSAPTVADGARDQRDILRSHASIGSQPLANTQDLLPRIAGARLERSRGR